jgi:imidazolonepropionase-like amidohydrolase
VAGGLFLAYTHDLYEGTPGLRPTIVILGGTLFDGTGAPPTANPGIVIRNGDVACVGEDCGIPADAVRIDAGDRAILPGLIDLHRHFFASTSNGGVVRTLWENVRMQPEGRRHLHGLGLTTVRSVGDPRDFIVDPRLAPGGRPLRGGHG